MRFEIDGKEVCALAGLQAADIVPAQDRRPAARAEVERFTGRHQFAVGIVGKGITGDALP